MRVVAACVASGAHRARYQHCVRSNNRQHQSAQEEALSAHHHGPLGNSRLRRQPERLPCFHAAGEMRVVGEAGGLRIIEAFVERPPDRQANTT